MFHLNSATTIATHRGSDDGGVHKRSITRIELTHNYASTGILERHSKLNLSVYVMVICNELYVNLLNENVFIVTSISRSLTRLSSLDEHGENQESLFLARH